MPSYAFLAMPFLIEVTEHYVREGDVSLISTMISLLVRLLHLTISFVNQLSLLYLRWKLLLCPCINLQNVHLWSSKQLINSIQSYIITSIDDSWTIIVSGDVNFPNVDWEKNTVASGATKDEMRLLYFSSIFYQKTEWPSLWIFLPGKIIS